MPENSIVQVAKDLGIGKSTLTHWMRDYREKGTLAFPGHGKVALTAEEAEIQRLKRELEIARQERDILKKATAKSLQQQVASGHLAR
jgi:transposase